jgi:hypothetical protein
MVAPKILDTPAKGLWRIQGFRVMCTGQSLRFRTVQAGMVIWASSNCDVWTVCTTRRCTKCVFFTPAALALVYVMPWCKDVLAWRSGVLVKSPCAGSRHGGVIYGNECGSYCFLKQGCLYDTISGHRRWFDGTPKLARADVVYKIAGIRPLVCSSSDVLLIRII